MFIAALCTIVNKWKEKRWMDKENMVHMHSWIPFSHKKEWDPVICDNIEGTGAHTPDTERQTLYDLTHILNVKSWLHRSWE
jgi:hypothetical protein